MEFKFNFDNTEEVSCENTGCNGDDIITEVVAIGRKCRKHKYNTNIHNNAHVTDDFNKLMYSCNDLYYLKPDIGAMKVQSEAIYPLLEKSDLESGKYEGGMKVWECTIDLLDYLDEIQYSMLDERVLDLGCGAGLLGVYAHLFGAQQVCFQDYNTEVIENYTLPSVEFTVRNNAHKENLSGADEIEFLSGDWSDVSKYFKDNNYAKFDLILSSETIYNKKYYGKLKEILENHLSETGIALFAAKKHYFGVGGGTYDFMDFLRKGDGSFDIRVVKIIEDFLPREILQVRKITVY